MLSSALRWYGVFTFLLMCFFSFASKKLTTVVPMLDIERATGDTTELRLKKMKALSVNCSRVGFWDSLVVESRAVGVKSYERMILTTACAMLMAEPHEKKALAYNEEAYAIALEENDKRGLLGSYMNWARYYCYLRNDAAKALDYCFKGLRLAEELKDERCENILMMTAGTCYFAAGQHKKALQMHLKCLDFARKTGNPEAIVFSLSDVGSDYHGMNNYPKASEYYLECKKYLREVITSSMICEILTTISSGHFGLSQYDSAYRYARLAVEAAKQMKNPRAIGSALVTLEAISLAKGDYAQAEKIIREALEEIRPIQAPLLTVLLTDNLEEACRKQGDYKGALEAYKLHMSLKDSLSNDDKRKQLLEMEFNYNLEKKDNENRLLALQLKQSRYVFALIGLLALFIGAGAYLFYRHKKLRAEQESDRLSQKLLRLQMNPHFIFNSLQAIQSFITSNDIRESVRYLGSFSAVTRHVLENSRNESIPLDKEIDLLRNYLDLQKLRFSGRFDYEIEVEEALGAFQIHIPPMLLQPFIENAVEHGMHDIEEGGSIKICYKLEDDIFVMEISDNGYGMSAMKDRHRPHRSLALAITRERIALMNKREKVKTTFNLTDAYPQADIRRGVKVSFRFSLKELMRSNTN